MRLRFIGILAVLAMMLALAAPVAADHATPINLGASGTDQSGLCTGDYFKIESAGVLVAGTHNYAGTTKAGVAFTATITTVITDGEVDSITVVSTNPPTALIVIKAGNEFFTDTLNPEQGISNVAFCLTVATPTLSLEKVVTGTGASQTQPFSFTADGGAAFNVTAADAALQVATTAGSHTIVEGTLPANWGLTSISCDSDAAPTVDLAARSVTVTVGPDEDVTCTFTNNLLTVSAPSPSLTLDKVVTAGNAALGFNFTLNSAAIAALSANDAPRVISTTAGAHTIVELAQSGWTLASVQCRDNATSAVLTTTPVMSGTTLTGVTVTVGADQDVTCTFTNTPQGGSVLTGNPPVRSGTAGSTGGGSVPNTAMELPANAASVAVLALIALAGLGLMAHRNVVATRTRR